MKGKWRMKKEWYSCWVSQVFLWQNFITIAICHQTKIVFSLHIDDGLTWIFSSLRYLLVLTSSLPVDLITFIFFFPCFALDRSGLYFINHFTKVLQSSDRSQSDWPRTRADFILNLDWCIGVFGFFLCFLREKSYSVGWKLALCKPFMREKVFDLMSVYFHDISWFNELLWGKSDSHKLVYELFKLL